MMYEQPDASLESRFLDSRLELRPDRDANVSWVPGHAEEFAPSIEEHCRKVAAELRRAGRAGMGRTVRLEEFINLFLTRGQLDYLYAGTPEARRPEPLTVSRLSPPYIAVNPVLQLEPWHLLAQAPALGVGNVDQMLAWMERYRPSERWPQVWPEFRRAVLQFIPSDLWPLSPSGCERSVINPYIFSAYGLGP
ncbi:hypothetical protein C8T65DRAFT_729804 [Cerioporus squamosus]|nr:hypothetical protein C8T65DRAFT_729804 [Cerioporus squamosus]